MAGLFAARVLSDVYREVVVIERDRIRGVKEMRPSVPHAYHAHALVARGQQIIEDFFPGFTSELAEAGVPVGDIGANMRWVFDGKQFAQTEADLVLLASPRLILEYHVRERVLAIPNVHLVEECDVLGWTAADDRTRVTGVRAKRRAEGNIEEVFEADLVLDAGGRGSRAAVWLEQLGYSRPEEEKVAIGLAYVTRHWRLPEGFLGDDIAILSAPTPDFPRGAILAREGLLPDGGERYLLSLNGFSGNNPPTDPDAYLEYARLLPIPEIYEAIRDAEPLDPIRKHGFPASLRRHYERLDRFPDGLLVMGDAVCSFNPIYAQGMTVASIEAHALREHLRRGSVPTAKAFYRDISRVIDTAWDFTVTADLAHPVVEGRRTAKVKLLNAYLAKFNAAAVYDSALTTAFLRVAGFIDTPPSLMRPGTLMRVWRGGRKAMASRGTGTHGVERVEATGGRAS
jgi:2-polyprenyl-6-methoxyphenol hydroxylase-like FAD-dependent oxidoreductase